MGFELTDPHVVDHWRERGARLLAFLAVLWRQLVRDKLIVRASGLAYASLLAIVPLIAVVFALFTAFEAFSDLRQKLQQLLLDRFLPTGQEQIAHYLDTFVHNSRDLGFVGFIMLIVTALLLLDNIDYNFNEMWHVPSRRSLISRLTAYTSILVFGTLLIGASVTVTARLAAAPLVGAALEVNVLQEVGSWLLPVVASALAFLLLFMVVPATRVRLASAAIGAAVTALTWELSKSLFAVSIGQSVRYSTLYGSLATVPIFLIWLDVTWLLVLLGLDVTYTHQNFAALRARGEKMPSSARWRAKAALQIVLEAARRFEAGEPPPTDEELASVCALDGGAVDDVIGRLRGADLLRRTAADDEDAPAGLVPARPLDRTLLSDVVMCLWDGGPEEGDRTVAEQVLAEFENGGREALHELTLADALERDEPPAAAD